MHMCVCNLEAALVQKISYRLASIKPFTKSMVNYIVKWNLGTTFVKFDSISDNLSFHENVYENVVYKISPFW